MEELDENSKSPVRLEAEARATFLRQIEAGVPSFAVFDTETASLKGPLLQVGIVVCDEEGKQISSYECKYIFEESLGVRWCDKAQGVHGLSRSFLQTYGIPLVEGMRHLREILRFVADKNVLFVAHNVSFDRRMISATAHMLGQEEDVFGSNARFFCTMRASQHLAEETNDDVLEKKRRKKAMRNEELYVFLHGEEHKMGLAHDALVDATITAGSFACGKQKGLW